MTIDVTIVIYGVLEKRLLKRIIEDDSADGRKIKIKNEEFGMNIEFFVNVLRDYTY